jgi:hypothetical protein
MTEIFWDPWVVTIFIKPFEVGLKKYPKGLSNNIPNNPWSFFIQYHLLGHEPQTTQTNP